MFDLKGLAWLVADGDMLKMRQMLRNAGAQLGDSDRLVPREVVVDLAIKLVREGDRDGSVLAFMLSTDGDPAAGDRRVRR